MGALQYITLTQKLILKYKVARRNTRSSVNLAYKIHGDSNPHQTPVIILHGLLGSKRNWESMSKKIAHATQKVVYAVDARNHGESQHHNSHTYHELATDVKQFMDNLNIKQADIIGHSMGGRTGMVLALTEPTNVSSLIVVDISPVSTARALNEFMPRLLDTMKSINFQGINDLNKAKLLVKEKLLQSKVIDLNSMGFILMNLGLKPDQSIGWICNVDTLSKYFIDISTFPDLSGMVYKGPTLFVGGEESHYIPPSDINQIKKYFPNAELKYVEDAGHNVHAENPVAFLQLVTPFLTQK